MKNSRIRRLARPISLIVALIFFLSSVALLPAQQPRPARRTGNAGPTKESRPRLVLLIVVDQFRYDYLTRFGDLFGSRGIGRLMREGASWTEANFDHVPTFTAPGHAVFMTGAWPSQTGIVANEWYERDTGKKVKSVTDDSTNKLGGKPGEKGYSPRRLLCSSVGDELRIADGDRSKVIGISAKDRSAILPAGRRANAAYWFGTDNGNMVSSTYYFDKEPAWVERFNNRHMADQWFGAHWDRLLPEGEYLKRAGKDDVPWENLDKSSNDTNYFPHVITGGADQPGKMFYKALDYTPFSNDVLVAFAEEAITNERLGDDADTDLLSVSFSANDYVGHRFGPYSHEAMDMTLRVDRQIGTLLDFVDAHIGLRNTLVIFSADHGASPVPEQAALMNLPGHRYQKADLRRIVEDGLKARYARKDHPATDYIQTFTNKEETEQGLINSNFYLNRAALKRDGIDLDECERVVGELSMRMPGAARYFTRAQLENTFISSADPIARRVLHGFYPSRSGDVIVVFEPYNILFDLPDDPTDPRSTATHGSPYSYDTHVPLIIMGRDFAKGSYDQAATPADIAPTLAGLLGVQAPSCSTGRVLSEALVKRSEKPRPPSK
ncbi:MAG TPA: alkaline phosphatase family protein [Pyrinomonadaceae bacterium]|nr:alkaline phosphatase family protein [Pyrinomonadaceae bacterium]